MNYKELVEYLEECKKNEGREWVMVVHPKAYERLTHPSTKEEIAWGKRYRMYWRRYERRGNGNRR